jgi:formylglycine-generating enzyme required for sulfatase activity
MVTWYLAAEYCNWLSKQDGLPETEWVYQRNAKGEYGNGMRLAPDYLKRIGYRLPTEAEWEYACRAGAATSRYYGDSVELLGKYAWYSTNSGNRTWPVGSLRPNDLGLFDMHGHLWAWCQDRYRDYAVDPGGKPVEDKEDDLVVSNDDNRVCRGGAFLQWPEILRAANRFFAPPALSSMDAGFRPARTFR